MGYSGHPASTLAGVYGLRKPLAGEVFSLMSLRGDGYSTRLPVETLTRPHGARFRWETSFLSILPCFTMLPLPRLQGERLSHATVAEKLRLRVAPVVQPDDKHDHEGKPHRDHQSFKKHDFPYRDRLGKSSLPLAVVRRC